MPRKKHKQKHTRRINLVLTKAQYARAERMMAHTEFTLSALVRYGLDMAYKNIYESARADA